MDFHGTEGSPKTFNAVTIHFRYELISFDTCTVQAL